MNNRNANANNANKIRIAKKQNLYIEMKQLK